MRVYLRVKTHQHMKTNRVVDYLIFLKFAHASLTKVKKIDKNEIGDFHVLLFRLSKKAE